MKIEIRNFKPHMGLSEETVAFTGTLYLDGRKSGQVSNRGTGGPNDFSDRQAEQKVAEWCKDQPPYSDEDGELDLNADFKISLIVGDMLQERDEKKALANHARKLRKRLTHPEHFVSHPAIVVALGNERIIGCFLKAGEKAEDKVAEYAAKGFTTAKVYNSTTGKEVK